MIINRKYKVGLLLPSRNVVMEPDCYNFGPKGVTFHSARMRRDNNYSGVEENQNMLKYATEAAELVAQAKMDLIIFGCTSGSIINGVGGDIALASSLSKITNTTVLCAATAVVEHLKFIKCKKLQIITPYIDAINEHEREFFENSGFEVVNITGMGIGISTEVPKVHPDQIRDYVIQHYSSGTDAIFISCTNLRAMEISYELEQILKVPTICSNQSILWNVAKFFNIG